MADKESAPKCEKEVQAEATETKTVEEKESLPKSSPSKTETNEALQHLVQGKRHLLVRDINSAVNALQEACRMLAEQYGETADPCGEAYFFYGKALLELSRIETGVLGNALDGVPEGDDADTSQTEDPDKLSEEEKMKVVEEVDEALEENFIALEKSTKSADDVIKEDLESDVAAVKVGKQSDEGGKEDGEVGVKRVRSPEKIVIEMELGGEEEVCSADMAAGDAGKPDSAKKAAADGEVTAKDVAVKTASEPAVEAMEVDSATLATASGDAAPATDSAASGGKLRLRSSSDLMSPLAAAEAKEMAESAKDGAGTARPEEAETGKQKGVAAAGEGANTEDKPIPTNGDEADTKVDDEAGTEEPEDADAKPVKAATVTSAAESVPEALAVKASGDTLADEASETAAAAGEESEPSAAEASETAAAAGEESEPSAAESSDMADQAGTDKAFLNGKKPGPDEAFLNGKKPGPDEAFLNGKKPGPDKAFLNGKKPGPDEAFLNGKKPGPDEAFLNGKKPGPSESTEGDDDDGEEADGEEQPAEAEDAAAKEETEGETKEGDSDTAEGEEGDAAKDGDTSQDCDTEDGEGEGEGAAPKEGDDEEEDVPNIQLAWEVLELAKLIFTRQTKDKPSDLKLSEVYQKLGEVSIEAENYSQAVDDLNNCLNIQKKHLDTDDRLIAETHYHLGVAHSLANMYSEAIAAFQASVDTILARVQRLQRQIIDREQGKKIEHENPFYKEETEIKELEDLLPDMKEKIADMRDMKNEAQKKIVEMFAASGGAGPSTSAAPISPVKAMMTSRPATSAAADGDGEKKETRSIGHLVKRKRLSNEPADEEAKRTKQENGQNGHADP